MKDYLFLYCLVFICNYTLHCCYSLMSQKHKNSSKQALEAAENE